MAFLPGSEGGAAVADALFGKVNPSGRLPVSWPKDSSTFPLAYNEPGKPYDPRYPFGYGLSYTRFKLPTSAPRGTRGRASGSRRASTSQRRAQLGRRTPCWPSWSRATAAAALVAFDRVAAGPHRRDTARLTFSAPAGSYKLVVGDLSRPIRVG